jgi:hypothetical protein
MAVSADAATLPYEGLFSTLKQCWQAGVVACGKVCDSFKAPFGAEVS